jgi:hypothetical protein
MKRLYGPQARFACIAVFLCFVLLFVMDGALLAQTTGSVGPSPGVSNEPPAGGCMPIGLTASGEVVFPFQCKGFIELQRGNAFEEKPSAAPEEPRQAIGNPGTNDHRQADKAVPLPPKRAMGPSGCTRLPSYDSGSGTYSNNQGRRLYCR